MGFLQGRLSRNATFSTCKMFGVVYMYDENHRNRCKRYRQRNLERIREKEREWKKNNRDWCREYSRRYYKKNRDKLLENKRKKRLEYLKEWIKIIEHKFKIISCVKCGYNKNWAGLDLHHTGPRIKDIEFGDLIKRKPNEERISKLEDSMLVCSTCHRELHFPHFELSLLIH